MRLAELSWGGKKTKKKEKIGIVCKKRDGTYQRICLLWSGVSSTVHSWCLQWQVPVYEVMLVLLVVVVAPVDLFASVAGSGW